MNRDDLIRMAKEANCQAPREDWNSTAWVLSDEALERFAALVAAAEREACAKVAGPHLNGEIAAAIRARGEV